MITKSSEDSKFDFKAAILSDSHKLALFLRLKESYMETSKEVFTKSEYSEIFSYKILSEKKNLN